MVGIHISCGQTTLESFSPPQYAQPSCPPELSELTELVETADDKLFQIILNDNHILSSLIPPNLTIIITCAKKYHNRELLSKNTHLFDCNFIVRLPYKDCY